MKSAVIVFPGSNCDRDMAEALRLVGGRAPAMVWHRESELPDGLDLIAIPGGFSYGDYLRSGAMAAQSPVMRAVREAADRGVAVLGICNGFQVLTEAHLLPGALMRNAGIAFLCRDVPLVVENSQSAFTCRYAAGEEIVIPVAHHDGNYQADARDARPARGRGPGRLPLCRRGQRLGALHCRHHQRGRQRARHDAPSRAGGGGGARTHRRPSPVRGPAGGRQPGGLTSYCLVYSKPAYYMRAAMENFAFEIAETARLIRREANRRAAVLGATKAQWRVLARLNLFGGGVRQIELAEALDIEPITLCRMLDRLEEAGLVERRRDDSDRRAWLIHLTDKAEPVITQLEEMGRTFNREILAGISDADHETAQRVLTLIREHLDRLDEELRKAS